MEKPRVCKRMIYLVILFKLKIEYFLFCLFHRGILSPSERSQKLVLKESISGHKMLHEHDKNIQKEINYILRDFQKSSSDKVILRRYKTETYDEVFNKITKIFNSKGWAVSEGNKEFGRYGEEIISFVIQDNKRMSDATPMLGGYR